MSEVVLRIEGKELVLDDSAVTGLNIKIDHEQVPCAEYGCGGCGWVHRRVLPTSHLTLDFGDGKQPQWREPEAHPDPAGEQAFEHWQANVILPGVPDSPGQADDMAHEAFRAGWEASANAAFFRGETR